MPPMRNWLVAHRSFNTFTFSRLRLFHGYSITVYAVDICLGEQMIVLPGCRALWWPGVGVLSCFLFSCPLFIGF
ncbi:hypothetical protein HOY80DRAFT_959915 [Tuber brumale]|nr:hypothetical protein HOY80DRAFT_959915 [Tuber brumale]